MPHHPGFSYRPDIDGLRAVAVLAIVLFHAGFAFPAGGFVGVDLFFVISGYLITGILQKELANGTFSLTAFYERRIRRIFPALFTVLAVTALAATLMLFPRELKEFGQSVTATTLFGANIFFWDKAGYFDAPAATKPLLHMWSLAVEEQFYMVFPLILLWLHRKPFLRPVSLIILTMVSFLAGLWATQLWPTSAFYLMPFRAWEFMLGALAATGTLPAPTRPIIRQAMALLGTLCILIPFAVYTEEIAFPGFAALPPVLGATFIILAGKTTGHRPWVNQLLSCKALVFLGLISYSLYLWHWPMLVLPQIWHGDKLPLWQTLILLAGMLVLSIATWHWVEQPFRRRKLLQTRKTLFIAAALAMAGALAFGITAKTMKGWPGRLPEKAAALAAYADSRDPRHTSCQHLNTNNPLTVEQACTFGAEVSPTWALWGDSHAHAFIPGFAELAEKHHQAVKLFSADACPSVLGVVTRLKRGQDCNAYTREVLQTLLADPSIRNIVLVNRYAFSVYGFNRSQAAEATSSTKDIFNTPTRVLRTPQERLAHLHQQFEKTVAALRAGGKRVFVVYPIPEVGRYVPETMAYRQFSGHKDPAFTHPYSHFLTRNSSIMTMLEALPAGPDLIRIYPHRKLCHGQNCMVAHNGEPLYYDDDHLSIPGSRFLAEDFAPYFAQQIQPRP